MKNKIVLLVIIFTVGLVLITESNKKITSNLQEEKIAEIYFSE